MAENANIKPASNTPKYEPLNAAAVLAAIPRGIEWLVAFSGGLDSTVLLHLLVNCAGRPPLRAVHVNHQINPSADAWQLHAEALCADWGIECVSVVVDLSAESLDQLGLLSQGRGLEDAARTARYQVFGHQLAEGGFLLLGHHQNDQAETLMLRLLRGAGVRGMAAMPVQRSLAAGQLYRPLLGLPRDVLRAYAEQHKLYWIEDDSNADTRFDRNYLRNTVLPLLASRWPGFAQSWSHSAAAARESQELLNELAQLDSPSLGVRQETFGFSLESAPLQGLSEARLRNVLRSLLAEQGFQPMPRAQMSTLLSTFFLAADDAQPQVDWANHQARRFAGRLYFLKELPVPAVGFKHRYSWACTSSPEILNIEGLCQLELELAPLVRERRAPITVCFRQGGERLALSGVQSKTLKNWLQEQGVPPWLRSRLPLVYIDEKLCAVGDLWSDSVTVPRVIVKWQANRE